MSKILKNPSNAEIKRAIEVNWYDFIKAWSKLDIKGVKYAENDEYFEFMTGVPYFRLNGVIDAQILPEIAEETVKKIISSFRENNLPFMWIIGPSSSPNNLREYLLKNKLISVVKPPGMALNLKDLPDEMKPVPDVEIIKVADAKALKTYINVGIIGLEWPKDITYGFLQQVAKRFFLPDNRTHSAYIAYYKGKPAAISRVFFGGGVAGIYRVTTLEEARRKGIGTAVSLVSLYEAKELGYEIATLIASDLGLNVYKKIGFKEYCRFEMFVWSPQSNEIFSVLIH